MNKKISNLLIIFSLFFSCQETVKFHTLDDAQKSSKHYDLKQIEPFLESTGSANRDIAAVSIFTLGSYLEILHKEPRGLDRKITAEQTKDLITRISDQLKKTYTLNTDFNLKCLCVQAISRVNDDDSFKFLLEALKDTDVLIYELAVTKLTTYADDPNYNFSPVVSTLESILEQNNDMKIRYSLPLFQKLFKKNEAAAEKLKISLQNYIQITENNNLKIICERLLSKFPEINIDQG